MAEMTNITSRSVYFDEGVGSQDPTMMLRKVFLSAREIGIHKWPSSLKPRADLYDFTVWFSTVSSFENNSIDDDEICSSSFGHKIDAYSFAIMIHHL